MVAALTKEFQVSLAHSYQSRFTKKVNSYFKLSKPLHVLITCCAYTPASVQRHCQQTPSQGETQILGSKESFSRVQYKCCADVCGKGSIALFSGFLPAFN